MSKVYHVVDFLDGRSTYVVPEWWLKRSRLHITAFWPPYKVTQQVLRAMRHKEPVAKYWTEHRVKILHSYTTLQQALQKVEDVKQTSNLESNGSEEPVTTRQKKSEAVAQHGKTLGSLLSAIPIAEQSDCEDEERTYYDLDKDSFQPVSRTANSTQLVEPAPQNAVQHAASSTRGLGPALPSGLQEVNPPGCPGLASMNGSWHYRDQHEQRRPFSAGVGDLSNSGSPTILEQILAACREQLEEQAKIKEIVEQQTAHLERVFRNQAEILVDVKALRRQGREGGVNIPTLPKGCPPLPVTTTAALKQLNQYLGERETLRELAQYFSHMGGHDMKAAARTILVMVIGHSVALRCSWAGSKGAKEPFCKLGNIVSLVLASIQPRYPDANKATVAAVIKKWLYSAGDRDGGRTSRRQVDGDISDK